MRAICIAILFLLPYTLYLLFLGKIGWLNITLKSMKHCQLPSEFNCSSNTSLHSYFHFKFVYNIVGLESMIWNTSCSLCSVHRKFPTYKWVVFQKFIFKWDLNLEHIFNVISRYMGYPSKAHFPHQLAVGASTCVRTLSLSFHLLLARSDSYLSEPACNIFTTCHRSSWNMCILVWMCVQVGPPYPQGIHSTTSKYQKLQIIMFTIFSSIKPSKGNQICILKTFGGLSAVYTCLQPLQALE